MVNRLVRIFFSAIVLLGLCQIPGSSLARPMNNMPNVTEPMLHADYWINKLTYPDQVIMSQDEIRALNQEIIHILPNYVYDLTAYPVSLSKESLLSWMSSKFPTEPMYVMGKQVKQVYYDQLKQQMNFVGVNDNNQVQYAFTVKRTSLRIFPTSDAIDSNKDPEEDAFQATAVLPVEPVIILHRSLDNQWYFVQTYNCVGWLAASDIAISPDRNTWLSYLQVKNFLVVTGNRIRLSNNPYSPEFSEMEFGMGSKIPLLEPTKVPALVDHQSPTGNYVAKLPVRNRLGKLEFKNALVPMSCDVSESYLPYTRAAIIRQAFKLEGERYGWGGILNSRDCSSMVMELYRCFGFLLPRNSEAQAVSAGKTLSFKGFSLANRPALLQNLLPGAILHFPGHVMLYLGEDKGNFYVINDLGSYAIFNGTDTNPKIVRVHGVVVNNLSLRRKNGQQWIEQLDVAKQLEIASFADLTQHWARSDIEKLANNYIIQGKRKNVFDPEGKITRAEFFVILTRALNLEPNQEQAVERFEDVSDDWFTGAVGAAVNAGLFNGYKDKKFYPDKPINRLEIAVILSRVLKSSATKGSVVNGEAALTKFKDSIEIPEWARDAVVVSLESGIIKGKQQDQFAPSDLVTRAETAVMLNRMLTLVGN